MAKTGGYEHQNTQTILQSWIATMEVCFFGWEVYFFGWVENEVGRTW